MIIYFCTVTAVFTALMVYQGCRETGFTPLDLLFFIGISLVFPLTIFCGVVVALARGFMWLENQEWMNIKIGGK